MSRRIINFSLLGPWKFCRNFAKVSELTMQLNKLICSTLYTAAVFAMCACSLKYSLVSAILSYTLVFFLSKNITGRFNDIM